MKTNPLRAPWLMAIARAFADAPVYAVGGAVRNPLMGLPFSDVDLCGPVRPEDVVKRCGGTDVHARLRAAQFGTVELHIGGHMAEYTTFRRDSYRGGHQPFAVSFADTVEEDALRRDFSVNALYAPLSDPDSVIDPVGGLKHLAARTLHTVTDDPDQVLKDDGLRILRAARFQAELGFTPTDAVLTSAKKYAHLLDDIVAERKRDELTRLLMADTKYPTLVRSAPPVSAGLHTLVNVGAWQKLFGDLEPIDFAVMDDTAELGIGAKCALLYAWQTPDAFTERMLGLRFNKRAVKAATNALAVLQTLQNSNHEPADVLRFGLPALRTASQMLVVLVPVYPIYQPALERAEQLLKQVRNEQLPASLREMAIGGEDLVTLFQETGIPESEIGAALTALWQDTVNGRVPNTRAALLAQARMRWIDSQNGE